MKEALQKRLATLKQEYASGQARLKELADQSDDLKQTMLRISGAIQVIEETLAEDARPD